MIERPPHSRPEPARLPDTWDVAALTDSLGVTPEPCRDLLFGDGVTFRLGPDQTVGLAFYPDHHAVELTSPDAIVSLRRPSTARPLDEHVLFQADSAQQETTLVVGRDGTASLIVQPRDPSFPPLTPSELDPTEAADP